MRPSDEPRPRERTADDEQAADAAIDEAGEESFPGSDPPSWWAHGGSAEPDEDPERARRDAEDEANAEADAGAGGGA